MRADVERDFKWQRLYIPAMKRIVGEYLIGEAPAEEDMRHNTDLIVLHLDAVRIACRVRTPSYLERYGDEFTIRSARPSGDTELTKVLSGWGQFLLYGFADPDEETLELSAWVLGNLNEFRLWFMRQLVTLHGVLPGVEQVNWDGSSTFRAFRIADLPPSFVVARKMAPTLIPLDDPYADLEQLAF